MKTKIIHLLILLILITSCSAVKKVEKSKINQSVNSSVSSSTDTNQKEQLKVTAVTDKLTDVQMDQIERESDALEARITEYDTDKPIVAGTNKPPVKNEKVITKKKTTNKDTTIMDNSSEKNSYLADYNSELENGINLLITENNRLSSELTSTKASIVPWWKWMLGGGVITLVFSLLVIWKWGAIISFFGKLIKKR